MTTIAPPQQPVPLTIEQTLHQAIAHHQAGQLQDAGELYQAILQTHPNHPEANHNMGVLAVQMKQPAAGLPYFMAALDAEPTCAQYWLNYIDALFQADQLEDARQVLALAQQQGLQGDEVEALAARLEAGTQGAEQPNSKHQHASKESRQVSSAVPQNSKKKLKAKPGKPGKSAPHMGENPTLQEIDTLVALFTEGCLTEAANLAQKMTAHFPLHEFGWKALGAVFKQMGRSADALAPMQKAAALSPGDVEAHYNLGVTLYNLGRLDEAEASYRQALQINPNYADAHSNLGVTLQDLGLLGEAEMSIRRALKIKPDNAEGHSNLGVTLHELGRLDEAEASYRRALQIKPNNHAAHSNLGITLQGLGRPDEAEASYRRALQIKPDYADAHSNLGITLQGIGRLDEAEACFRHALQINPDDAKTHNDLGITLQELGRLDEADAHFQMALQINPDDAKTHNNRGNLLRHLGRLNEAEVSFRKALQINPNDAKAHGNLGKLLRHLGRLNEAEVSFRRALEIKPEDTGAQCDLGLALQDLGLLDKAEACYRSILQSKPDNAGVSSNLGQILLSVGRLDEAEAYFRHALEIKPDHAPLHSNLLYYLTLSATAGPKSAFSEHAQFGEQFEPPLRIHWPKHANLRDPERCLQIGFVSADFHNHAVASFIEPVLTYLSSYPQLSLHAYDNNRINDSITQRLRGYFAHWHPIADLSDAALTDEIHGDGIDILIDLSGHTAGNRLLSFARKPAPVQASWIGYPSTTGLKSMDYYLADRFLLPPGQFDDQFTEKIVRLPANAPFLPSEAAPPVNALPALSNGYVTFGSFNRPNKLSHAVIALWSQLLRTLPDSRMMLGAMPEKGQYDTLIEWFAEEGIARERLDFHPRSSIENYLSLHHWVDICLDTFPYNGGTTTCHALWMGIPTLTLTGDSLPGRVGVAILSHVGLEDFMARDKGDFVQKGVNWAGDLATLANLRAGLRERFRHSAMGQPELVAAGVERALRIMWQRWCAGLPAESLEVSLQDINSTVQGIHK